MRVFIVAVAVLAVGCDNFEVLRQLKPRKVTIRANDLARAKDGSEVQVPLPAAGAPPCELWVDASLNAGWHKYEGKWVADGICEVRDVLPGETLVRLPGKQLWFTTALDDVDLGIDYLGRKIERAAPGTTLTLDLQGAAPFSTQTALQAHLYDFGEGVSNVFGSGSGGIAVPMGTIGSTSFPVTVKWDQLPLLKSGEPLQVFQGTSQPLGKDFIQFTLVKRGLADVVPTSGKNVRVGVAMTDIPTRAPAFPAVAYDPAPLYEKLELALPAPQLLGTLIEQSAAVPGSFNNVPLQTTFTIDKRVKFNAPATAVDPFPNQAWNQRVSVATFFESFIGSDRDPPKGALGLSNVMHGPANDLAWLQSATMAPVQNIKAKVPDFDPVVTGPIASTAFTLTWDEPTQGLPNAYIVQPYKVTIDKDEDKKEFIKFTRVAQSFRVSRPEAHIPPDVLEGGSNYVFSITAENCTASDARRPRRINVQSTCGLAENRSLLLKTP